jgi:hypothetical protein
MKKIYLLSFFIYCFIISAHGQGGVYYNALIENFSKNTCSKCTGTGFIYNSGVGSERSHKLCGGQGCYDCDNKGTEFYIGKPFNYKCGYCLGSGKSIVLEELKNIHKLKKIYISDYYPNIYLYGTKEKGFQQPVYSSIIDDKPIEYLYYNEKTKRVFDQQGNPLFDIGYKKDDYVEFIYCGSESSIEKEGVLNAKLAQIRNNKSSYNRKIRYPVFGVGQDFSRKNGANSSGSNFNVTVRYSMDNRYVKNSTKTKFPLSCNAVSTVPKEWLNDDYFEPRILDLYIVMMYITTVYNEVWYENRLMSHVYQKSYEGLKSNSP